MVDDFNLLSPFYYPTSIVVVDDNQSFSEAVSGILTSVSHVYTFTDPIKALSFLENYAETSSAMKTLQAEDNELYASEEYRLNINLTKFMQRLQDPDRFKEIAIVIVDYHMEQMNGIELACRLRELKSLYSKIILITADKDRAISVDALNEKQIDFYIMKSDPDFNEKLNKLVIKMQMSYFTELSKSIIDSIKNDTKSILSQPGYSEFMKSFCKKNKIAEYYLIDPIGSMLLLDDYGNIHWLVIKNEADLNSFYDLASDSHAPSSVLEDLESRKVMPFFATKKELSLVEGSQWENFIYPANIIPEINNFFYAHVKDKALFPIHKKEILSYDDFLKNPPKIDE